MVTEKASKDLQKEITDLHYAILPESPKAFWK